MSMVWSTKGGVMPNELSEIEVDEVSLVDRPATGKRFVLFKRGGLMRRAAATTANICSEDVNRLQTLEKRAVDADEALNAVRQIAKQLEQRIEAIETGVPPRQSRDAQRDDARSLWAGVL